MALKLMPVKGDKYRITEWDDSQEVVVLVKADQGTILIRYQDGVVHAIGAGSFETLKPEYICTLTVPEFNSLPVKGEMLN